MKTALLISILLLTSCSTTAYIEQYPGSVIEGKIVRSSRTNLEVKGVNGLVEVLDRETIRDIDHPGNVAMVIGGGFIGYGAIATFAGTFQDDTFGPVFFGPLFMLSGAIPLVWGFIAWRESIAAAEGFDPTIVPRKPRPRIVLGGSDSELVVGIQTQW